MSDEMRARLAAHREWVESGAARGVRLVAPGAGLTGAVLTGADLEGADLEGAVLRGADLRGAFLMNADLRGAFLTGTFLTGADLAGAVLRGAFLTSADLKGADLTGADMTGADLKGAVLPDGVPTVPRLASAILGAIGPECERLDMRTWHTCETVHCVAGWTVVLAGAAGAALEREHGTPAAAALIWAASTGLPVLDYYCGDATARDALRDAAAMEVRDE